MSTRLSSGLLATCFIVAVVCPSTTVAMGLDVSAAAIELSSQPAERASAVSNARPVVVPLETMKVQAGLTAAQDVHASDVDGDPLTFSKGSGPAFMTVTTIDSGNGAGVGRIHLAPASTDAGLWLGIVVVSDGALTVAVSVTMLVGNNRPDLTRLVDLELESGTSLDQPLSASDLDGDPLTFQLVRGPDFISVTTTGPTSGRMRLTPSVADAGDHLVVVGVSDGSLTDETEFYVSVIYVNRFQPALTQPDDMIVNAGSGANQALTASDADGEPLSFSVERGPRYMAVSTVDAGRGTATGNIWVAPALSDAPPTPEAVVVATTATVRVTDGALWDDGSLWDRKSFTITASFPADSPPTFTGPLEWTCPENAYQFIRLAAYDPDGDAVRFDLVSGPPFVGLIQYGSLLSLRPSYADAGIYPVVVRATDARGLSDEGTIRLTIRDMNSPPELDRPSDMITFQGRVLEQDLHASDIDGSPLAFSKGSGPEYMTVSTKDPGTGSATGSIRLAPGASDLGGTFGTVYVSDGIATVGMGFRIEIHPLGAPVLLRIGDVCIHPGQHVSVPVASLDPEGDRLTFSQSGLPAYGSLIDRGDNTAVLEANPPPSEPSGSSFVAVTVTDGIDSDTQLLTMSLARERLCPDEWIHCSWCASTGLHENRFPTARAGGPYVGYAGRTVSFDGRESFDTDGEAIRLAWDFGDGAVGVGLTPTHVYQRGALYSVVLLVTDGVATSRANTTATIADALPARAYAPEGRRKLRLAAGAPTLCLQIEPVGSSFDIRDVDLGSMSLKLTGVGSTAEVPALSAKTRVVSDHDENGVEEIGACFSADEIRQQLVGQIGVHSTVTVELEGRIVSGGKFRASFELEIFARSGPGLATVSPNPLNPVGLLSFSTSRPGPVRVLVYGPGGRLVRIQYEESVRPAGDHEVTLDGRASNGQSLGSGVYFYRLETVDGNSTGRFVILK